MLYSVITRELDEIDHKIGERLKTARCAAGIKQSELGKVIGVTYQQVQKQEHASNRLSCSALVKYANHLGVSPAWFFAGLSNANGDREGLDTVTQFFNAVGGPRLAMNFLAMSETNRAALCAVAKILAAADQKE